MQHALRAADSRSFRDQVSLDIAREFGASESDSVVPDLAFALDMRKYTESETVVSEMLLWCTRGCLPIGISRPYHQSRIT